MYKRFLSPLLRKALNDTPVVFLNGPRQAGKSTLAELIQKENPNASYSSLDNIVDLSSAKQDPQGFISSRKGLFIIDEIQHAPELYLAIKRAVDLDRQSGRFLLTGSANIMVLPRLADALVGRMEILTLLPLSLGEIHGVELPLIEWLFDRTMHPTLLHQMKRPNREAILTSIAAGGFPEVQQRPLDRQKKWFQSYISTLLQRDMKELADIESLARLPLLLELLAARSATLLNADELSRSTGIASTTLKRYLVLLEALFLTYRLPAWAANHGKRLIKRSKVLLGDSGLLFHLLNLSPDALLKEPNRWGPLLETFVINEFRRMATWSSLPVSLWHYRTTSGHEVDLVLETSDRRLIGIEIKATETPMPDDFKGLMSLAEDAGARFQGGFLFHLGESVVSRTGNIYALPLPLPLSSPH